jgi:nuclear protein localization family protein 4
MLRVQAAPDGDLLSVIEELSHKLPVDVNSVSVSNAPNGPFESLLVLAGRTPVSMGFKNGEMLYLKFAESQLDQQQHQQQHQQQQQQSFIEIPNGQQAVLELPIDIELKNDEGLIPRKRSRFCRHGDKGMCEYCSPLPPWDNSYREENQIKHISFHAYVKRLDQATNKGQGSSYMAPLSESNFAINKRCIGGHEPWPKGICSKCQPSAITLQQQEFRMVDHLEFANSEIVNSFIESWRQTGTQRIGFMYGTYQRYDKVPLGIKGVVEAIYEPAQHDENDGLTLGLPWEEEEQVDNIAKMCGLQKIGVIFTDLTDSGDGDGSVICKRHKDSFFLSSLEVIFAAKLQKRYPNYTKSSDSGRFSSKFVTCVISGNLKGEIDMFPYQVSEGAEALVQADMITGSTKPSFAYINETNDERYVPEIFYTKINEYKLQVKTNAKPAIPVDYLLVTLSHGFPQEPNPVFKTTNFPIENRQAMGVSRDLADLKSRLDKYSRGELNIVTTVSDFHLLTLLLTMDILSPEEKSLVARVATGHQVEDGYQLAETGGWQTLLTIVSMS